MNNKIKVFTAFSGYDSQCLALNRLKEVFPGKFDYELVGWSEIDEYAIKAHNILFPEYSERNYGDISKVDWSDVPDFDLLTYSSPCFTAGTKVLTLGKNGEYIKKNIEEVCVDDFVMTHKNRFKKVIRTMCHKFTGELYTFYTPYDSIKCTPNHPFFVAEHSAINKPYWVNAENIDINEHDAICIDKLTDKWRRVDYSLYYVDDEDGFYGVEEITDKKSEEYYMHFLPIQWREKQNVKDIPVFNLEVEDDHSYVANNFVVKNCTDISLAGKQLGVEEGSGTRSSLLWECRRCIEAKKPKYLLFENVSNLVSSSFMPYFQKWMSTVRNLGYVNFWSVLNAKDYGIPQNRDRVFMVSIRQDDEEKISYNFPNPITPRTCRVEDMFEDEVTEDYYVDQEKVNEWSVENEERIKDYIATRNNLDKENLE